MTDSIEQINEDVMRAENISSAKCMGYLSRVEALYGVVPQGEPERKSVELPTDFLGQTLNVGDVVCRWNPMTNQIWNPDEPYYTIQSLELWEDGWVLNVRDECGDYCEVMRPRDCALRPNMTVRDVLASFIVDYANDVRKGGDGTKLLDKYEEMFYLKGDE